MRKRMRGVLCCILTITVVCSGKSIYAADGAVYEDGGGTVSGGDESLPGGVIR